MKTKMTCVAMLLAFSFLAAASTEESYRFVLDSAARVGAADLNAGNYTLTVGAQKVVITHVKTGKVTELVANIERVERKFDTTEIHSQHVDGVTQIREIRFGGSKTKITFE